MVNSNLFSQFQHLDRHLTELMQTPGISPAARVHPSVVIAGPVVISPEACIEEFVVIHGPCFIGPRVHVGSFCKLRPGTFLEADVRLENHVEVKHSLISQSTHIHTGYIGDSYIGRNCRIGAGFVTANRRLDRRNILIYIDGQKIDTHTSYFGCLMGDRVKVGVHCGTNPGAFIPDDTVIKPMTMVSTA
jgi:UDP-N-acetylglucosamine diphosphorylase / glucose-1-phosphate thymidylyltransferase / UDP-N-acetylgalactosamine diphosphorylase / glucosamine-1-phosphate N-acetyltransferase / galactosamine-1-phosphate N-acetyltransferase